MSDFTLKGLCYLAVVVGFLLSALVFSVLWGWFVVPLGVPSINVAHAMGIGLMLGVLRGGYSESEDVDPGYSAFMGVAVPLFALAVGAVLRYFV